MTGKGEKQKRQDNSRGMMCARARASARSCRLCAEEGGSRSGQGASYHLGSRVTPEGPDRAL